MAGLTHQDLPNVSQGDSDSDSLFHAYWAGDRLEHHNIHKILDEGVYIIIYVGYNGCIMLIY